MTNLTQLNQLNEQVVQTFTTGNINQALTLAKQAANLATQTQITNSPIIADSFNNLAELYRIQGQYSLAEPLYIKSLKIREKIFGKTSPEIAQSLNNLASLYYYQENYPEAEKQYLAALEIWQNIHGENHPQIATILNNIGELYREQERYPESEKMHNSALAIRKKILPYLHPQIAESLNNIAAVSESQRHFPKAEQLYLEALEIRKNILEENHPDIAATLNNIAALYDLQGRYLEAEKKYLEALEILKKSLHEHPDIAYTLNNLGEVYKSLGHYSTAEKIHKQALEIKLKLFANNHPSIATSLSNLAEIYRQQGNFPAAEANFLSALKLRKHLFGSEHQQIAASLEDLAVNYTSQGRYREAESLHLQALEMRKKLLGTDHLNVAKNLTNLASIYRLQGRYSQAEQTILSALAIQNRILGDEHPDIATLLENLAGIYRLQGRYLEAEKIYRETYSLTKRLLGDMHINVARSLNSLAVLYDSKLEYYKSAPLLNESLIITRRVFGNEHPETASCMSNLATVYGCLGRYSEAENLLFSALEIRKKLFGNTHPDIALSLNNLAEINFSQGRYLEAEQKYTQVLEMRKALLGDEHPDVARSLNNLATTLTATGKPYEALSYRIQASKINDKVINQIFSFSSDSDRLAFLEKIRTNFDLFLSLVYQYLSHSEIAKQQALDFILKRKALTASVLAAQNQAFYSGKYPHLTEQFRELSDLSAQLVQLTFTPPQSDSATYQENLAQIQAKYNILQKQLASQVPEIKLSEQIVDTQAIANALPPESTLVEFVRFDVFNFQAVIAKGEAQWYPSRYLAFILPAGKPNAIEMIDLGTAQTIDDLIQQTRWEASQSNSQTLAWNKKTAPIPKLNIQQYNPTAAIQLSQILFAPIRQITKECKHLLLAPDGDLNLLPLQILPLDGAGNLIIDEYTISYLSVGRDILRSQQQIVSSLHPPLIIADPDFDLTDEQLITQDKQQQNIKTEFLNTSVNKKLERAVGTRFLGESIAKKLKNARLYLDAEALESLLTTSECPSMMLIATHGIFIPDSKLQPQNLPSMERYTSTKVENPMLRSGLALAGANTWLFGGTLPPIAGKGVVLAQDIAGLDLWSNELTVLSACDTAVGDIKIGEGVFGLRRAFAIAGSKTLIMSLWSVPDKATALLMERFFNNLQSGMGRLEALQNAQKYIRTITVKELRQSALGMEILKEMLQANELLPQSKIDCDEGDTPLNHPGYWGAWICQGDTSTAAQQILYSRLG